MMHSINVCPYNGPYIQIAEEAIKSVVESLIAGIISILKYLPGMVSWCQVP